MLDSDMNNEDLQRALDEFDRDPRTAMERVIEKRNEGGLPARSPFSTGAIENGDYVAQRDRIRARFPIPAETDEEARIARNDLPAKLVDKVTYSTLEDMDRAHLTKARLDESPWSDDYWGIYLGILGRRYADPQFPNSEDWKANFDYVRKHPASAILASHAASATDRLSPSEKYDLLVGDTAGKLTAAMWAQGKEYYDEYGKVEQWMGICHGWAPAAYMLRRPCKVVEALAADGKTVVRFYPSDIKALASLLWANASPSARFIGGRCSESNPKLDENGRVLSSAAFDTNPGTWHVCVVNQIGAAKRSFVMDATYDYEVWNQPVHAYQYSYFNPQTMKVVKSLREATVARGDFKKDRFRKYRTSNYTAIAGISMRVKYVVETAPSHAPEDKPSNDALQQVVYHYDIELDDAGKILGGEWYQNKHPDFLWTPAPGLRAVTSEDAAATGSWDPRSALPPSWCKAAVGAAANGTPPARIVEALIDAAQD